MIRNQGFGATDISPIVVDLETCALVNAETYLEPVEPARNLKAPEKIKADIETRTATRTQKIGLDWNVGRIAALGWWTEQGGVQCRVCPSEREEAPAITEFWDAIRQRLIIGFNIRAFDMRYLVQRSRYLGLSYPILDLGRYNRGSVRDLYTELTFADPYHDGCMKQSLKQFCRRFGIPVEDEVDGRDIQALVDAGDWDAITSHCRSDVELTRQLGIRLGVINVFEAIAANA